MRVIGCCTYPTTIPYQRGIDYDAHDFVHAVKGKTLNGYTKVDVRGVRLLILNANLDRALEILGVLTSDLTIDPLPLDVPVLMPVPNGRSTLDTDPPRTLTQAQVLAGKLGHGAEAIDLFRWQHVMPSAHNAGGTRDAEELYSALAVRPQALHALPGDRPYVLVDDVLTTGGHLQACAAALEDLGHPALVALVAGVSDRDPVEDPFAVRVEEVEDFVPRHRKHDW